MKTFINLCHRGVVLCGSTAVIGGLLLPLLLWSIVQAGVRHTSPTVLADGFTFRLFFILIVTSLICRLWSAVRDKQRLDAALVILLLAFAGYCMAWYGFRFSGTMPLAEGEQNIAYLDVDKGRWGAAPSFPIALVEASRKKGEKCIVSIAGAVQPLSPGQQVRHGSFRITMKPGGVAPLFIFDNSDGSDFKAGYIKLRRNTDASEYFDLGFLPYRFYVSFSGDENKIDAPYPDRIEVTVTRGKLVVARKSLIPGGVVAFEGHSLRYEQGIPWYEFIVERGWHFRYSNRKSEIQRSSREQ